MSTWFNDVSGRSAVVLRQLSKELLGLRECEQSSHKCWVLFSKVSRLLEAALRRPLGDTLPLTPWAVRTQTSSIFWA